MKKIAIHTLILSILFFTHADASLAKKLSLEEMSKDAHSIRIGTVQNMYSTLENNMIYTFVTVEVSQTLKGDKSDKVVLKIPGGTFNGYRTVVHGVAHFKKGEETLLFLSLHQNAPIVMGLSQGKYKISKDQNNAKNMVSQTLPKDIQLFKQSEKNKRKIALVKAESSQMELSAMIQTIQKHIK